MATRRAEDAAARLGCGITSHVTVPCAFTMLRGVRTFAGVVPSQHVCIFVTVALDITTAIVASLCGCLTRCGTVGSGVATRANHRSADALVSALSIAVVFIVAAYCILLLSSILRHYCRQHHHSMSCFSRLRRLFEAASFACGSDSYSSLPSPFVWRPGRPQSAGRVWCVWGSRARTRAPRTLRHRRLSPVRRVALYASLHRYCCMNCAIFACCECMA